MTSTVPSFIGVYVRRHIHVIRLYNLDLHKCTCSGIIKRVRVGVTLIFYLSTFALHFVAIDDMYLQMLEIASQLVNNSFMHFNYRKVVGEA